MARLHLAAFDDSVLGRLGHEAVRRNYVWQLDGPHDVVALVAERAPQSTGAAGSAALAGYLIGGRFRGSTVGFVRREKWFLIRAALRHPGFLTKSVGWRRLVLGVRLLFRRRPSAAPENPAAVPPRSFGVLAIAVDPMCQGTGVGRALMVDARGHAEAAGYGAMHLSVHPENDAAIAFYRSLGWVPMPEPNGEWTGRLRLSLGEKSGTA